MWGRQHTTKTLPWTDIKIWLKVSPTAVWIWQLSKRLLKHPSWFPFEQYCKSHILSHGDTLKSLLKSLFQVTKSNFPCGMKLIRHPQVLRVKSRFCYIKTSAHSSAFRPNCQSEGPHQTFPAQCWRSSIHSFESVLCPPTPFQRNSALWAGSARCPISLDVVVWM